jgi:hypothetical protein
MITTQPKVGRADNVSPVRRASARLQTRLAVVLDRIGAFAPADNWLDLPETPIVSTGKLTMADNPRRTLKASQAANLIAFMRSPKRTHGRSSVSGLRTFRDLAGVGGRINFSL